MPIFKLKPGPVVRWSRGLHAAWGAAGVQVGSMIGGKKGAAWGGAAVVVGGFAWEVSNRFTGGYHQYGDMWDWLAFVGGALATGAVKAILKKTGVT